MRALIRSTARRERGTIIVEFALMFPVLVAFFFGIIDAGRFIATRTMLAQAAAAGARAASLNSTTSTSQVLSAVQSAATMLSAGISVDTPVCSTASTCVANWTAKTPGDTMLVTARYTYTALFFPAFSRNMSNTSRVIVE